MSLATLLQIVSSCLGVIGSLFFAIGVMRQSTDAMANLAGTYWDANPHMVTALAAQKADYLFGGGLIVCAFATSLLSYPFSNVVLPLSQDAATRLPWIAITLTFLAFFLMRLCARRLSGRYEQQVRDRLKQQQVEWKQQDEEQRKARAQEKAKRNT